MTTNVPQPTFGATGFTAPAASDIFTGATADINAAFGGNLNPAATTPQGQLATSWTAIIAFCYALFVKITTQFDPAYAEGRMQDGLARIYFLERDPAQSTVVSALCSGLTGTVIPVGSLAQDADGNTYSSTTAATIGTDGTVAIPFANIVTGAIACAPGALTVIYRAIAGWDSITNTADGVLGNDVEGRDAFELRRQASVALNAVGSLPAIKANVLNVSGVLDAYVTENDTADPVTIGGVTVGKNALYVSVAGGDTDDIAAAIWRKKMPGCATSGTTAVVVQDANSGYVAPYPSYTINLTVATSTAIYFAVNIVTGPNVPSNAQALIAAAIIDAFAGGDGGARAKIGSKILASRYYAPVMAVGSWVQIISIKVGLTAGPTDDDLTLNIDQVPAIASGNIVVTAS